ncbi:MAG TPA: TolC family protein [Cyclobacteriaceae bacterium]|nr:TolC family protein [Cyclobacteriaceae bacterium]
MKYIRSSIKAALVVLCWIKLGFLQAQVISLDSVLATIRERNPMLADFRHRIYAMNEFAKGAKALMAPEVGGGPWMFPYPGSNVTEDRDKGQVMISVQQRFTNPAKLRANQAYLDSKAAIEQAGEQFTFNELRAQAKTAYYQWLVLEKEKSILLDNREIIQLVLKITRVRYPYNQTKFGNIYKAEGRLSEVENMLLMNENSIIQKNIVLNQLMNLPKEIRFAIDTTNRYGDFIPVHVDTTLFAQNRSDINRIDRNIQSMRLSQTLERKQLKPDFTLGYNHMVPVAKGMPSQYMLLGMITIPIAPWSSKMYRSNISGMENQIRAMKSERESILNELEGMTDGMVNEIQTLRQQVSNYEKRIIPSLNRNYETLMLAYEENREELPIVIDAYEALLMAQLQYLNTLTRFYEMIVTYEKLLENE